MKKTAILCTVAGALAGFAMAALAAVPKPLEVTAADVQAAGYANVKPIAATSGRWKAPTAYFTSDVFVSNDDAKRDCKDCGNVIAAYAAVTNAVPGWSINQRVFVQKVGGRWQGRAYLKKTKTVIVVTAPDQERVGKLLEGLKTKFGG